MKRKALKPEQALIKLEELCARAEQCTFDLRNKLFRWGVESSPDDIIESLEARGFVNDERFARAFVRDKYRFDRWGRLKIARALASKRISRTIIDEALGEIDIKEYARNCYHILQSKRKSLPPDLAPYGSRQKLMRFAAGRGYEPSLIIKLLDNDKLWD